jgi:hypothetical protein
LREIEGAISSAYKNLVGGNFQEDVVNEAITLSLPIPDDEELQKLEDDPNAGAAAI